MPEELPVRPRAVTEAPGRPSPTRRTARPRSERSFPPLKGGSTAPSGSPRWTRLARRVQGLLRLAQGEASYRQPRVRDPDSRRHRTAPGAPGGAGCPQGPMPGRAACSHLGARKREKGGPTGVFPVDPPCLRFTVHGTWHQPMSKRILPHLAEWAISKAFSNSSREKWWVITGEMSMLPESRMSAASVQVENMVLPVIP